MTQSREVILGLDIGERRIGVALADSIGRIASPIVTLTVDGTEVIRLQSLMLEHEVTRLIVGLPRNLSGEETQQSQAIRQFVVARLNAFKVPIDFQDESLTSVAAEDYLNKRKKKFTKGDIDAHAASIILQDYLEARHG